VKVLESVHEILEEIEQEYVVLRDHGHHPNLPAFHGLFIHRCSMNAADDQLWIAMEVEIVPEVYFLGQGKTYYIWTCLCIRIAEDCRGFFGIANVIEIDLIRYQRL